MKTWEYLSVAIQPSQEQTMDLVNNLGQDGWEMVCVVGHSLFFKRRILDE